MEKIIFSLPILFLNFWSLGQIKENDFFYYETCYSISKVNKADALVEKYFEAKGKLQPKDQMYYYDIAVYFLEEKNYPKAYKYMVEAIHRGLSFEQTRNFEINEFDDEHKKLLQKDFLNDRNKTISYFYTSGSGDLMKFQFIRDLFTADQTARYQVDFAGSKNKMVWNYIAHVDSLNMDTLVKFIKKFGMVNTSNMGGDSFQDILFIHLKRYNNPYLDSCIKDNCAKRLLHPAFYTFAIDEAQNIDTTVYGTLPVTEHTVFLDLKNVDRLRNSVGLESLYENSLYEKFKLPKGYIIPEGLPKKYEAFFEEIKKVKSQK